MDNSVINQIKDRLDLVDLIQGYLRLQKAGMNFKGLCPFHNEKTPSFIVSPDRQIWHCFGGCNEGGDHFKFVMKIEGVEFSEALRTLAKKAGVELKGFDREAASGKTRLYQISELAAKFFEKQLWDSQSGRKAVDYLRGRGLSEETTKKWRIGYAPNTWNALKSFLKNAGYKDEEVFKAGLTIKKQESRNSQTSISSFDSYDRFRGRIMFPISDLNSQVVGFTGRVFEEIIGETEMGKYMNTPQTLIYDKSRILYGLDKAKLDIRKSGRALVVEGNMDLILSHQAGVKNAVASSGTALTAEHLKVLKRYTENVDLCFDRDQAGETAAKRGIDLALARGFNVGIVKISAKDPADLVKEGSGKWIEAAGKSQPIVQFYIEKAFERHDPTTALGKKNIATEVLPIVKLIENEVEQSHWLGELSIRLKVDQKILVQAMASAKAGSRNELEKESVRAFETPPRLAIEEALLALLMRMPEKARQIEEEEFEIFTDPFYNNLFAELRNGSKTEAEPLSYEDSLRFELVKFKSEQFFGGLENKDLESEVDRLIKSLKKELVLEKIKDLELKIKSAKSGQDVSPLLEEVRRFSNRLSALT